MGLKMGNCFFQTSPTSHEDVKHAISTKWLAIPNQCQSHFAHDFEAALNLPSPYDTKHNI